MDAKLENAINERKRLIGEYLQGKMTMGEYQTALGRLEGLLANENLNLPEGILEAENLTPIRTY